MSRPPVSSQALEANIASYRVDVEIDARYRPIQNVMARYHGLREALELFLKELSHPYRNREFIATETRSFALGYFHALPDHADGPAAAELYLDTLLAVITEARRESVRSDAAKTLFLLFRKIIRDTGPARAAFETVLSGGFDRMAALNDDAFRVLVTGYYPLSGIGRDLRVGADSVGPDVMVSLCRLLRRYLDAGFACWLAEPDPGDWFARESGQEVPETIGRQLAPIGHESIRAARDRLAAIAEVPAGDAVDDMLGLPDYGSLLRVYREMPRRLGTIDLEEKLRNRYKLLFLFFTMTIPGLAVIHDDTLREVNRVIAALVASEDVDRLEELIRRTFQILSGSLADHPDAALMCVLNLGRGVYRTVDPNLVSFFNRSVLGLGFQAPGFQGISNDWQIRSNVHHIQNIRIWMTLITLNPPWSQKLLSALIINLSLYGVLIKDTDLFPRDISRFLSAPVAPVYNLVKQLMRLFPAYFNEIGAEGRLRDISTQLDEITRRQDRLLHFLRKQSHVESSSAIVELIEGVLDYWRTGKPEALKAYLPEDLYATLEPESPFRTGVGRALRYVMERREIEKTADLLDLSGTDLAPLDAAIPDTTGEDRERVRLAVTFYQLLNQKYRVDTGNLAEYVERSRPHLPLSLDGIAGALKRTDPLRELEDLLEGLLELKALILSDRTFDAREDIYRKRHFSVDIPSMYGSYHETRFDAMALTLRLESRVNILFEQLTDEVDLGFVTRATFYRIHAVLVLFHRALQVDGIPTREFERQLDLFERALSIRLFTFTQYVDIFRGFARVVGNLVSDHFDDIHKGNLQDMADVLRTEQLRPKYRPARGGGIDRDDLQRIAEIFIRDIIASSLSLQRLDLFLSRVLNTLHRQAEKLPTAHHYLLLTFNPGHVTASITQPGRAVEDIVHLGNKGLNIVRMRRLGLPVPPGFIVTTEVFRCRELIEHYLPATREFRSRVDRELRRLERATGRGFGDPDNALLVSVRSGAAVSQPGMMDTYLNVGINEEIVEGMIAQTGRPWFVWDCFRRFLQSYGMSFGLARDDFDAIINEFKDRFGVTLKKEFSPEQMRDVALAYKAYLPVRGVALEWSPREQLDIAIRKVLNSWDSPKARTYRKIIGISDDWGTSVTVQAMVYGNLSDASGSGVLFTHSPKLSPDLVRPWGDYTVGNQGEDVVSGLVATQAISVYQARQENRPVDQTLEKRFPRIFSELSRRARQLVDEEQWTPQDIEFTFESPEPSDLYVLQTRDMQIRERKRPAAFIEVPDMAERFLGHGIGVSGGALWGRAVFSKADIERWRREEPNTRLILVRNDTVPDDIAEISLADGLLTARGGATSHAAIVANRLGKTCVVGCPDLVCRESEHVFTLAGQSVGAGDYISIDGFEGSIYIGAIKTTED